MNMNYEDYSVFRQIILLNSSIGEYSEMLNGALIFAKIGLGLYQSNYAFLSSLAYTKSIYLRQYKVIFKAIFPPSYYQTTYVLPF
jgi:hypothetical protein